MHRDWVLAKFQNLRLDIQLHQARFCFLAMAEEIETLNQLGEKIGERSLEAKILSHQIKHINRKLHMSMRERALPIATAAISAMGFLSPAAPGRRGTPSTPNPMATPSTPNPMATASVCTLVSPESVSVSVSVAESAALKKTGTPTSPRSSRAPVTPTTPRSSKAPVTPRSSKAPVTPRDCEAPITPREALPGGLEAPVTPMETPEAQGGFETIPRGVEDPVTLRDMKSPTTTVVGSASASCVPSVMSASSSGELTQKRKGGGFPPFEKIRKSCKNQKGANSDDGSKSRSDSYDDSNGDDGEDESGDESR
jgi:hypothetical protein